MRVLGWLLLIALGFPLAAAVTWVVGQFLIGFWEGLLGFQIASSAPTTAILVLVVWALLARWYWLRGRRRTPLPQTPPS